MERVKVDVAGSAYEVLVGSGLIEAAGEHLPAFPRAEKAFVVSDREVGERWFEPLAESLRRVGLTTVHLFVPVGEEAKTLSVVDALYRQLAVQEAHRDDVVVALGGGAVGDLAGFLAATYMRGVAVVQVPTTLTAQVDAAIGGKTAVNLPEGKNLVGAFHQPCVVLADVGALATLSGRDYRSGLAEVGKYGLTLDLELLASLEDDLAPVVERDPARMEWLVSRCVAAKARTVAADERDAGDRLILNYGHTLGHALERLESYEGRSHGEAIAVGMVYAARLAEALDMAGAGLVARHAGLMTALGLETAGTLPPAEEIMAAFRLDKKYHGGVRFILLADVGEPRVVQDVPEETILRELREMGAA